VIDEERKADFVYLFGSRQLQLMEAALNHKQLIKNIQKYPAQKFSLRQRTGLCP
jgi:hypothetical protein